MLFFHLDSIGIFILGPSPSCAIRGSRRTSQNKTRTTSSPKTINSNTQNQQGGQAMRAFSSASLTRPLKKRLRGARGHWRSLRLFFVCGKRLTVSKHIAWAEASANLKCKDNQPAARVRPHPPLGSAMQRPKRRQAWCRRQVAYLPAKASLSDDLNPLVINAPVISGTLRMLRFLIQSLRQQNEKH